jgi:HEAT repeat protein
MGFSISVNARRLLRRVTLVALAALIVAGLLVYRDHFSPRRVWQRTIRNPDPAVRVAAWNGVQRDHEIRGLDRGETIREVFGLLDDPDPQTRLLAVSTLPMIDPDPLLAIPRLAAKLADSDVEVRARAASAIGEVFARGGPGREEAIAAVATALKDADANVRCAGLAALGQVVYSGGKGVDPLRSSQGDDPALELATLRLGDADIKVRVEAAFLLACNDRGAEAVPMLVTYLRSQPANEPPTHTADRAFLAMMVLAINSDQAAGFLGEQLSEKREGYPERPRDALAWAAKQSPEARLRVKRLASGMLDPANPSLRHHAGLLLHQIGSDQAALPVLIEALGDPSVEVRIIAVEALADMGGIDPTILEALETATKDSNSEVRERASAALEAIEWAEILSEIEGIP